MNLCLSTGYQRDYNSHLASNLHSAIAWPRKKYATTELSNNRTKPH